MSAYTLETLLGSGIIVAAVVVTVIGLAIALWGGER